MLKAPSFRRSNITWRTLKIFVSVYIMDQGMMVHAADVESPLADKQMQKRYCSAQGPGYEAGRL